MFSRGNIIQKGNQKNIREPYTILPHFSISQRKPFDVPCQNPLWHAFTEINRTPQNSCASFLPLDFIHFIHLARHRQLTIARVARTRPLIDPRPFVTTTAGKWSPFTCRAGKNLASLSAACLLFTPRETLSILSPFQRGEIVDLFLFPNEKIFQDTPWPADRLKRESYRSSLCEMINKIWYIVCISM